MAKLDRLTRSVKDLCNLLELFEKRKVALISVAESLDTASAAGRLVITIMAAVSQWEREAIGERTRDALRHKRSQGQRVGNIPFGSRLAADGKRLEPDAGEQEALPEIRRLRGEGASLRRIAAALNGRAYRTRRGTASITRQKQLIAPSCFVSIPPTATRGPAASPGGLCLEKPLGWSRFPPRSVLQRSAFQSPAPCADRSGRAH